MTGLSTWIAHHPRAAKAVSGVLVVLLLVGGLSAGIHRASVSPEAAAGGLGSDTQPLVARVPASRHSLVGVVRLVGPRRFVVRNQRGVFFAVRWGPTSRFRAANRAIRPGALRAGDHVLIIGKPAADGTLDASVVTITAAPQVQPPTVGDPSAPGGASPSSTQ